MIKGLFVSAQAFVSTRAKEHTRDAKPQLPQLPQFLSSITAHPRGSAHNRLSQKGGTRWRSALSLCVCATTAAAHFGMSAPVEPPSAFKQAVDGCTFEIDLVPFKGVDGQELFVSTTEIPWELFDVFVYGTDKTEGKSTEKADAVTKPTKPYIGMDREFGHVGFPTISPSYLSVQQFCEWLSVKTGRVYRLPTGEEWKALCGQSGIDPKNCGDFAWTKENSGEKTHKLASKKADKLGCFDLFGNACEWVNTGEPKGSVAGGSFLDAMSDLDCGVFQPCKPVEWNEIDPQFPKSKWWYSSGGFVGFRVICEKK